MSICWRNEIIVFEQIWCYSSIIRIANLNNFNSTEYSRKESIVCTCLHEHSNKHMQIYSHNWILCQLPVNFLTPNPPFFALLWDTVPGPWKHFFFAARTVFSFVRWHWRDTTEEVTSFPGSSVLCSSCSCSTWLMCSLALTGTHLQMNCGGSSESGFLEC